MRKPTNKPEQEVEVRLEDLTPQEIKFVAGELAALIRANSAKQSEDQESDSKAGKDQ